MTDVPVLIRFSENGGKSQSAPDIFFRWPSGLIRGCTAGEWANLTVLYPNGLQTIWTSSEGAEPYREYDRALRQPKA